ncbi:MAG: sugar phosphate isomerase/epimerase family protein [Armatimonadota bacterium]
MIRFAYHPASYLRQDIGADEALEHIGEVGWDGFEWSSSALADHFGSAEACRECLSDLGISLSGIYHPSRFESREEIEDWIDRAEQALEFGRTVGADVLMLDGGSTDLPTGADSIARVAEAAAEVAQMASDAGMACTWHQHWGTLFQYPEQFHALMDATEMSELRCTLDTAHLTLGGFDVPATFRRYVHRMCYVHLKDLSEDRRFADLGAGIVDLAEAARILIESDFSGWVVNDLDYTDEDAFESGRRNLSFIRELFAD